MEIYHGVCCTSLNAESRHLALDTVGVVLVVPNSPLIDP